MDDAAVERITPFAVVTTSEAIDPALLRTFAPLDGFKQGSLAALARKISGEVLPKGRNLFREGVSDNRTFYLVRGEVLLRSVDSTVAIVRAGTDEARYPLAPSQPRRFTARTASEIEYLSIDCDLLDVLLTWDQTGIYEVNELGADSPVTSDDWMTILLQAKALQRIPASNLQAVFTRMQRVPYRANEIVVKQGDEGDYFYVITAGSCAVTHTPPLGREAIKLAVLGPGDTFGEEALISGSKRSATVTMLTDGSLMRLAKDDFDTLLAEPTLDRISFDAANELVAFGTARWLDVRLASEFEREHLPGSINVPLYLVRLELGKLDPNLRYVVVCDTGRRSSAGAFILKKHGFDVSVLEAGLTSASVLLSTPTV
jgi:CRP-like cAMP-binding protein